MLVYHGSNIVVEKPKILVPDRKLDFGSGFYVTSSYEQAERWARTTVKRRETGKPFVSVYEFSENNALSILKFDSANIDWLEYVSKNRKGILQDDNYVIVSGPVANDTTMPVIGFYFSGIYTAEEAIKRLKVQNLKDQFAFRTEDALKCLKFLEAKAL